MFSIVAVPVHQGCTRVPFSSHPHQLVICGLFGDSSSDRCEVISHCGFDLHLSDDVGYLFVFLLAIYMSSLEKCLFRSSAHVLKFFIGV